MSAWVTVETACDLCGVQHVRKRIWELLMEGELICPICHEPTGQAVIFSAGDEG